MINQQTITDARAIIRRLQPKGAKISVAAVGLTALQTIGVWRLGDGTFYYAQAGSVEQQHRHALEFDDLIISGDVIDLYLGGEFVASVQPMTPAELEEVRWTEYQEHIATPAGRGDLERAEEIATDESGITQEDGQ